MRWMTGWAIHVYPYQTSAVLPPLGVLFPAPPPPTPMALTGVLLVTPPPPPPRDTTLPPLLPDEADEVCRASPVPNGVTIPTPPPPPTRAVSSPSAPRPAMPAAAPIDADVGLLIPPSPPKVEDLNPAAGTVLRAPSELPDV